ncbi:hypothetical protein EDF58_106180 [Novosphingobium sp. PhB57]|jgi:hypothetical protein|uniref:hypothetical protein n=1 Tax=unclassified Novosphingobium TaxID=2644732 RepID=UPI0010F3686A|nr:MULTISPECIES: hypothetical protein [unclassified Novosphingobium]TCU55891.1 hypothetical protein EDF58_106180 [Novosphingobium sp. PhB57]TDW65017.1 hypothetical protein EDF57_103193 [Novosphingobium sp. PhB55]
MKFRPSVPGAASKAVLSAALAIGAVVAATPAAAQVTAEANVARSEGDWGGELALGVPVISDGGFSITPAAGVFFHHRDHPGYVNQDSQCFNKDSGNQVSDGKCDNSGTKIFGKVEAMYRLPMSLGFGVGARLIGDDLRAYGTVAMPILPRIDVKGNFGDHYLAAGLQARF